MMTARMDATYGDMVKLAAGLIEPNDTIHVNPEYIRGMAELLADIFPKRGETTGQRATAIAHDMGVAENIYVACNSRSRKDERARSRIVSGRDI